MYLLLMKMKPKLSNKISHLVTIMDYKEPKKRVTKNDKKNKQQVYSQKHVRNLLKQMEATKDKRNDGSVSTPKCSLLPNERV